MNLKIIGIMAVSGCISLASMASASVVSATFDGVPPTFSSPYTENGLKFSMTSGVFFRFNGNELGQNNGGASIVLEETDGSAFDLLSVDIRSGFGNVFDFLITADLFSGGTVSSLVSNVGGSLQTFAPGNFLNVTKIVFSSSGNYKVIDNVSVETNPSLAPVPLPAALPLLLVALGGLGFAGRRRKAA